MAGHRRAEAVAQHAVRRRPQGVAAAMPRHRMKSLSLACRVVRSLVQRRQPREAEGISNSPPWSRLRATTYLADIREWDFEIGRSENSNPKSQDLKLDEPPEDCRSNLRSCDFGVEFSDRPFSKSL